MWHDFIRRVFGVSETILFGNSLVDWVAAALLVASVWALLWLLRQLVASRYRRYTIRTVEGTDDIFISSKTT